MNEVHVSDEFLDWYQELNAQDSDSVQFYVTLLEAKGVTLPHPYCSEIAGASFALRELRVQSGGRPLRVFYAFDPKRDAYLILGGDKTGDDRFYERMIPLCEKIWTQYQNESK